MRKKLGLDSLWVTDHVILPDSAIPKFGKTFDEPLTVLGYVAGFTSKVAIGTSAIILPYRNPVVTAKQLSTLDVLSGGRLIFGAAAGWAEEEFKALEVGFADRGSLSDEHLKTIKALWTRDHPEIEEHDRRFSRVHFHPKPVQTPHLPIWIGGNSRRGIRRAAELGDVWHPTRPSVRDIRVGRRHLAEAVLRAGRQPEDVGIAIREPFKLDETFAGRSTKTSTRPSGSYSGFAESLSRTRRSLISLSICSTAPPS